MFWHPPAGKCHLIRIGACQGTAWSQKVPLEDKSEFKVKGEKVKVFWLILIRVDWFFGSGLPFFDWRLSSCAFSMWKHDSERNSWFLLKFIQIQTEKVWVKIDTESAWKWIPLSGKMNMSSFYYLWSGACDGLITPSARCKGIVRPASACSDSIRAASENSSFLTGMGFILV